jgi:hypothetical protein
MFKLKNWIVQFVSNFFFWGGGVDESIPKMELYLVSVRKAHDFYAVGEKCSIKEPV